MQNGFKKPSVIVWAMGHTMSKKFSISCWISGNGFKLFKIFGDKAEKKPVKDEQKLTSKSGISSTFASDRERTSEPGF